MSSQDCRLQVSELERPLKLPSLHVWSARDQAVTAAQSRRLEQQFDASRRQHLAHDLAQ